MLGRCRHISLSARIRVHGLYARRNQDRKHSLALATPNSAGAGNAVSRVTIRAGFYPAGLVHADTLDVSRQDVVQNLQVVRWSTARQRIALCATAGVREDCVCVCLGCDPTTRRIAVTEFGDGLQFFSVNASTYSSSGTDVMPCP